MKLTHFTTDAAELNVYRVSKGFCFVKDDRNEDILPHKWDIKPYGKGGIELLDAARSNRKSAFRHLLAKASMIGYLSVKYLRYFTERVGFEPTEPCGSPVFKTGSLNHSDTFPLYSRGDPLPSSTPNSYR